MRELDKALADIDAIRSQLAASTTFRGFGPAALLTTGLIALAVASGQSLWMSAPLDQPFTFFVWWIAAAVVSVALIGAEMVARTRHHHGGLCNAMIYNAVQQFLPAGAAGAFLALALAWFSPDDVWMLPGLWQVLFSLGLFASARVLPKEISLVAAWYFITGFAVLFLASKGPALSPWMMGIPFCIGQGFMALVVHHASGDAHAQE